VPRRRLRAQGSQAGLREVSGTTAMQCEGMVLVAQAFLPVPQVARDCESKMLGSDGGVGLKYRWPLAGVVNFGS